MINIHRDTLMEAWREINHLMIETPLNSKLGKEELTIEFSPHGKFVSARQVALSSDQGFGLNESEDFQFFRRGRMKRLEDRYVDPDLWTEDLSRLFEQRKQAARIARIMSFSFNFHRRALPNKPVPKGGGCLVGFTLTFNKGDPLYIDALSRSTEITRFFYSDMLFLVLKVREILKHCEMTERLPEEEWRVRWSLAAAHQNDVASALFALTEAPSQKSALQWFLKKPFHPEEGEPLKVWEQQIRDCFWNVLMTDEPKTFFTKGASKRLDKLLNKNEWNQAYLNKWGPIRGREKKKKKEGA